MRKATFTVTLSKASETQVTVQWATADGTAKAPDDYTAASGQLVYEPGELSKIIEVEVSDDAPASTATNFYLDIKTPVGATISRFRGTQLIPGAVPQDGYLQRFQTLYAAIHAEQNGYFGPQTGPNARTLPRHTPAIDSLIINEAPNYGGQTVSETVSFQVGLEAWNGYVTGQLGSPDWSGYNQCWVNIDKFYVPSAVNQPVNVYDPTSPADYTPEGDEPNWYPRLGEPSAPKGIDPLYTELANTYGNKRMYLMHWILDVEGMYGFKNADGTTKNVFVNTYERGMQESSFESVTHPCWNDWTNGGGQWGYEPLYTKGKQLYPEAPFDWNKKWSYTNAPDSEGRAIQWAFWANKFAQEQGAASQISTAHGQARKMGDYFRYNLMDKYFRKIGDNQVGGTGYQSCHYLINWYAAWGGGVPESGGVSEWGYRIGCSECHQGYQSVDAAYALATGGGGMTPQSPSAGDIWLGSLYRQIEMIRWLQSPEGPIAGGVTNSFNGRYETPTDGRQLARFYGMDYTYSPVWHDPVSNNWVGFQAWGQGRTADLFVEVSDKTTSLANAIRPNLEIILDRLVAWFMTHTVLNMDGSFTMPSTIKWTSDTQVVGQTATAPNHEGVYEFLPSLNWDGTGAYAQFWNQSTVPNPNLHCEVIENGTDLGVAASTIYLLLAYAKGKRNMGKWETTIPNTSFTAKQAYELAKELLDRVWDKYRDAAGICIPEPRSDYLRLNETVYIPPNFTGTMPNGDVIQPGVKFVDLQSFVKQDPKWPEVQAYINDPSGSPPVFLYHRFWANAEFAIGCAAIHRFFGDLLE